MNIRNVEFKAAVTNLETYEEKLKTLNPIFKGCDNQTDTYFKVSEGRLKLREGNIENALISYRRNNIPDSKLSEIILYKYNPDEALKAILCNHLSIAVVVKKKRLIYFVDHVKFHFDDVEGLGTFMEVEVIDINHSYTTEQLKQQCDDYLSFFKIEPKQLISKSYSDLFHAKKL